MAAGAAPAKENTTVELELIGLKSSLKQKNQVNIPDSSGPWTKKKIKTKRKAALFTLTNQ